MIKFTHLAVAACAATLAIGTANAADPISQYAVTSAGDAVTELQDGHNYLIYDAHSDDGTDAEQAGNDYCRYAFRYASGENVYGTHVKPVNATNLGKAYVWTVTENSDGTYSFQNLETGTWVSSGVSTLTAEDGSIGYFTLESTDVDTQFKLNNGEGVRWDGNGGGNYPAVGWAGDGHPISFYEVTDDNTTDVTYYPVSATFTQNGVTIASATDIYLVEGSTVFTSTTPVSASSTTYNFELGEDVQAIRIKNIRKNKYVSATGSATAGYSLTQLETADESSTILQVGDSESCQLFSPTTLSWIGTPSGSGTSLVSDQASAPVYTFEVDRTGTATINATVYYFSEALIWEGSGTNGWNDLSGSGVCSWSKTDAGSRWYAVAYDDTEEVYLAANTADVCIALQEAIASATEIYAGAASVASVDQTLLSAVQTALAAANAARIGFDDFDALTTTLNSAATALSQSAAILPLAQAVAAANEVLAAYPAAENPTPGYFNATDEAYVTFTTAIQTATALVEANNTTDIEAQVEALNAAVTAFKATERPSEPYFTALYRIINSNGRGTLYFNEEANGQVYYTAEATEGDDNALWALVKDTTSATEDVYLYNVGANQFISVSDEEATESEGEHYGEFWTFGEKGANIALTPSAFGYPTLEISTGETHLSISTYYAEPIITYYEAEDGGVPFKFEYVEDIDETVKSAIDSLLSDESAISEVGSEAAPAADAIYDLQGRRVARAAAHGIYIVNGKKIRI